MLTYMLGVQYWISHKDIVTMCGFRRYPYPSQGWSLETPRGGVGGLNSQNFLKESMKVNSKLQGERRFQMKTLSHPWGRCRYFLEPCAVVLYTSMKSERFIILCKCGSWYEENHWNYTPDCIVTLENGPNHWAGIFTPRAQ